MRMGVEWDAQSVRALQSFLNKNGSDMLVSGNMGLFSGMGSNWKCSNTVRELQKFLNKHRA